MPPSHRVRGRGAEPDIYGTITVLGLIPRRRADASRLIESASALGLEDGWDDAD
jgi:hypothetical protein